jgi:O-antigen/teichoic acid export membrane protein
MRPEEDEPAATALVVDGVARDVLDTPQAGPTAIRGSLLRFAGYGAGVLLSIVSVSFLIRHLGVSDFGRYVTVISLITIVQGVTDAGLSMVGVREYSIRSPERRESLMRNLVGARIVLTAAGVLAATGFAALAGYGDELVLGTVLVGIGLLFAVTQTTLAVPLMSMLRLGSVTALDLLRQLLLVVGILALIAAGAELVPFLALQVPIGLVVLLATAALVRGSIPMRPSFDRREWWLLVRDVLPFAAAAAIGTIYLRLTVIAMSLVATELETGYYATAYRVMEVIVAVPPLVVGATLPILARAARDDERRLQYVLQRLLDSTLIVGVGIVLAVTFGAPFAIDVLAGGESDPSIPVLRIQAIAIVAVFVGTSLGYGLLALHRYGSILFYAVAALVAGLGLNALLVPSLEAEGAAIAYVGAEVVVMVLAYVLLMRAQPELHFSLRVPLRVAGAGAVAGGVALVPGLPSLPAAAAASALYVAALFGLRAVPQELLQAFKRRGPAPNDST